MIKIINAIRMPGILILLFSSVMQSASASEEPKDKSNLAYIELLQSRYAAYEKYEDTGTLNIVFFENNEAVRNTSVDFSTTFKRTGEFEINWVRNIGFGDGIPYKIWRSKDAVMSQYRFDAPFESRSLYDALSRAVGISNSLTYYVPCLLMPNMECFVCDSNSNFTVTYNDTGTDKTNLQGADIKYKSGNTETFWIDKKTFQLREIEWWNEIDNLRVYHQIKYTTIVAE